MKRAAGLATAAALALAPVLAPAAEPAEHGAVPDWYCLSSAMYMIRLGEDAVAASPDDELAMRRRGWLYAWRERLAAGEPPCEVYREIFEAVGHYF